jgi:hypothetical protein
MPYDDPTKNKDKKPVGGEKKTPVKRPIGKVIGEVTVNDPTPSARFSTPSYAESREMVPTPPTNRERVVGNRFIQDIGARLASGQPVTQEELNYFQKSILDGREKVVGTVYSKIPKEAKYQTAHDLGRFGGSEITPLGSEEARQFMDSLDSEIRKEKEARAKSRIKRR